MAYDPQILTVAKGGTGTGCTIEITAVSSAATETEDITQTWLPGDLCQLYVHSDGVATVYVSNFQLAYDNSATVAVASTNS